MRYRTIVADPPWHYGKFNTFSGGKVRSPRYHDPRDLPYATLTVDEIAELPVDALAADAAHLYLWTTQRYLWDAPKVAEAWGFKPSCVLTWCKAPMGTGLGFAYAPTTEFVVFAHRGGLQPQSRQPSTWWQWKRGAHSAKPEAFLDIVETVSPGPYLELFARRRRLGWDVWGNEVDSDVEMPDAA
jgi:N6-adenosine-specific RNA methylase IME4